MPRKDPGHNLKAIRAYHRASAALRDKYRDEWEILRTQLLDEQLADGHTRPARLPSGPALGRKPTPALFRRATVTDLADARAVIVAVLGSSNLSADEVLKQLTDAGFLFMRSNTPPAKNDR